MKSKIIRNYKVPNNSQVVDKNNNCFLISMSQEYNNIQTEICSRGGDSSTLISKDFIKSLINNKDYEITSRNTRDFS